MDTSDIAIHKKRLILVLVGSVAFVGVVVAVAVLATQEGETKRTVQELTLTISVLDRMPVIDGHNDFPWSLRNIVYNDLRRVNFNSDLRQDPNWKDYPDSATDLPRLREGKVGAQFWVAYTECKSQNVDSVEQTMEQVDIIKRLVANYSDDLMFATSVADIERAIAEKKIASLVAVEGGHSIQSSFAILRMLYELGARYMTLTHNCNTPWADAAPVDSATNPIKPGSNGLSQFGLEIIDEMNRLGMMVDLSHVSRDTQKAAIARSKAPVIFSHSSAYTICNHHRNVRDDVLRLVKAKNGIVMVNFYRYFIQCDRSKNATLEDVIAHLEHIRNITGPDHIGIGGDYDGTDENPIGLEDVSKYPVLFAALAAKGWNDEDLEKLAGRNILRVFRDVETVRDQLNNDQVNQGNIPKSEIIKVGLNTSCITAPFEAESKADVAEEVNRGRRSVPEEVQEL